MGSSFMGQRPIAGQSNQPYPNPAATLFGQIDYSNFPANAFIGNPHAALMMGTQMFQNMSTQQQQILAHYQQQCQAMAMQFMSGNPSIPGQFNPYVALMGGTSQPNQPVTQQALLNPQQQAAFYDQMQKSYLYAQQAFFANGTVAHSMPP